MSNKNKRLYIKPFSGATVDNLKDHINPIIGHQPDRIIIHAGTNNLMKDEPKEIVEKLVKLCGYIQKECNVAVAMSELTIL